MKRYGIFLGLMAFARLLSIWGFRVGDLLAGAVASLLVFSLLRTFSGDDGPVRRLLSQEDTPYLSWAAATAAIFSGLLVPPLATALWWVCVAASGVLFAVAMPYTWARRRRIDLAHVAWYGAALVTALNAPPTVPHGAVQALGWLGFAGVGVVLFISLLRILHEHDPQSMRSPWYGVGGSSDLGLWVVAAMPAVSSLTVLGVLAVLCIVWVISVAHHRGWTTQGAWANLFSLCSLASLAMHLHFMTASALLTGIAALAFAVDAWVTFSPRLRRLQQSRAS